MSRTLRTLLLPLVALLAIGGLQAPASAATQWGYIATAAGTQVKTGAGLVISSSTAQSAISGIKVPNSMTNSVATVAASGLLRTGAVETSATSRAVTGGTEVTSWARTAGVNVLNGLVTADAVTSTLSTIARPDGSTTTTGGTQLVGIKIAGAKLPLSIPKNYGVTIPGIANVTLNAYASGTSNGATASQGWGLSVALLKAQGDVPAGAVIIVNPAFQTVMPATPAVPVLTGHAYGTHILAKAGDGVTIESPTTAMLSTPPGGSNGTTLRNTTAGVNVPGVLTAGAVESTSTSSQFGAGNTDADNVNTNETARLNLLGGVITADAIKVRAHSRRVGGTCSGDAALTLVNLTIAGRAIPINVAPNTTIEIPNVAKVIVNEQYRNACTTVIRGLHVTLLKPYGDMPVGADIEAGKAFTGIL